MIAARLSPGAISESSSSHLPPSHVRLKIAALGEDGADRCDVGRGVTWAVERLTKSLHASVRRVLRQAWQLDDAGLRQRTR
jgi:hypothetical protein